MMTVIDVKQRQKSQWGAAAAAWGRYFDWYSRAFRPLMDWCCDAACVATGTRLLDVACGSGQPAFTAAARVGAEGHVTAIDLAPEMLAACTRRAGQLALHNVEFLEMDAESLRFEDESFDAVTCSCGLMFFPDVARALAEMRRVLRPAGRIAVAVWDDPSKSPFLSVGGGVVAQFFPPAPANPNAPGGFRFSRPGVLETALRDAGFRECTVQSLAMPIDLESTSEYCELLMGMSAGMKEKLDTLSDAARARLRQLVEDAARPFISGGRLRLAATPLCAAARR